MKVALCCVAKNENCYLKEYFEYYLGIGFDDIFIYDNNDIDGEKVSDIADQFEHVTVIDKRGMQGIQYTSYNEFISKYGQDYDWTAFFDCDEYLNLKKDNTVKEYLSRECFKDFDCIKINWRNFGDNGLLGNENNFDRNVLKRFKEPNDYSHIDFKTFRTIFTKSIIRTKEKNVTIVNAHITTSKNKCTSIGEKCGDNILINWDLVSLDHYRKTIIEFIEHKLNRGWADNNPYKITYDWFWDYSKRTPEKEQIIEYFNKYGKIEGR